MRISRAVAGIAALLLLAGCEQPGVSGSTPTQTTVTAGGQRVTILAPAGFCVDPRSTSVTSTGAFVLVSDCALVGAPATHGRPGPVAPAAGTAAQKPPVGAALTASVSPTGLGDAGMATRSLGDFAAYARTPEGLALVGRGGQSRYVRILESAERDNVLYLYIEDRAPQAVPLEPRFWRAFLEVNGRLTAVSEIGFAGGGLDKRSGLNLVSAFVRAIKAANPTPAAAPAPAG